jgi:transposase-like protein
MDDEPTSQPTSQTEAPSNRSFRIVPQTVVSPAADEVIEMLAEQVRFSDEPETRAVAIRLLESGYTVATVARRLELRASTVWGWADSDVARVAIEQGKERRRAILGQNLEEATDMALTALVDVAGDTNVAPQYRVKAAESILDRCGITPETAPTGEARAVVAIDIDFDERLARIVAGSRAQIAESE